MATLFAYDHDYDYNHMNMIWICLLDLMIRSYLHFIGSKRQAKAKENLAFRFKLKLIELTDFYYPRLPFSFILLYRQQSHD